MHRIITVLTCAMLVAAAPALAEDCSKPLARYYSAPMEFRGGRLLLPMTLQDTPVKMVLSTGMAMSMLNDKAAQRLGLRVEESNNTAFRANGVQSTRAAHLPHYSIGNLKGENAWFQIAPDDKIPADIAGYVTSDVLGRLDIDLDFGSNTLNIISADHCDGQVLYWNPSTYAAVSFVKPLRQRMRLTVNVDGHDLDAIVDTAQPMSSMPDRVAANLYGLDSTSPGMKAIGTQPGTGATFYRHVFDKMTFGGITVSHARFNIVPDNTLRNVHLTDDRGPRMLEHVSLPEVVIGMNVLRKLHVYFANGESKLYISTATNGVAADDGADPKTPVN